MSQRIYVPRIFWEDHKDRCPSDNGDAGLCAEIAITARHALLECTPEQLECLRSDAAFYCHRDGPDECPPSIRRSAKATLATIAKHYTSP